MEHLRCSRTSTRFNSAGQRRSSKVRTLTDMAQQTVSEVDRYFVRMDYAFGRAIVYDTTTTSRFKGVGVGI